MPTYNKQFHTVRILFHDIDAKFDTTTYSAVEAGNLQMMAQHAIGDSGEVILIPPKDKGVTSGAVLKEFSASKPPHLYTIAPYGRAHIIKCSNMEISSLNGIKYLYLSNDDPEPIGYWNERLYGWIVPHKYTKFAISFIERMNHDDTTYNSFLSIHRYNLRPRKHD